jgi:phosphoglycolate phosphatase
LDELTSRPRVRAVLFDLDGTLVHTRIDFPAMREAVLDLARVAGIEPSTLAPRDALGLIDAASALHPDPATFRRQADDRLVSIELEACGAAVAAEGAVETLSWLIETGVRVGIVTRNSRAAADVLLRRFPIPHEVLLTRSDTPRVKPDPIHLSLALEQLGVEPQAALMVGDHTMDVLGGKAAGMLTIGILTDERPHDFFATADPDAVIRVLPELRGWIFRSSW